MEHGHWKVADLIVTTELEDRLGTRLRNPSPILASPERLIRERCNTMINYRKIDMGSTMVMGATELGQMRALPYTLDHMGRRKRS